MNCNFTLNTFLWLCILGYSYTIKAQNTSNYFIYTVTEQDKSLWGICRQNGTDVETVMALNNMSQYHIKIGDKIKIPNQIQIDSNLYKNKNYILHTVKKEDKNLWRICENYAVFVDSVLQFNQKKTDIIQIGEKIKIPTSHLVVHIIKKSDKNLWRICQNYGVNLQEIKRFNRKKDNIIREGEQILIPRKWISKKFPSASEKTIKQNFASLWENLGKPVFDLDNKKLKFPYQSKKSFKITPEILQTLSIRSKLDSIDIAKLYQQTSDDAFFKDYKKRYYYSLEEPFVMDLVSLSYYPITQKIEHGYSYDFISILELDSAENSIKILPVFLYQNHFGDVKNYFGNPLNGAFACCAQPHPLAHYSKNSQKEIIGQSKLLTPSVLQYTEITKYLQGEQKGQVDSVITILQLETFDLPTLIDIEEYKNGVLLQGFKQAKRRKELGY